MAYVTSTAAEIYLISLFEGRQHVLADASNLPLSKVHVFHVIPGNFKKFLLSARKRFTSPTSRGRTAPTQVEAFGPAPKFIFHGC